MPSGVVHDPVDSSYAPPSSRCGNYLPTQSQTLYHSASSSPADRPPSSGFDGVNEDVNIRANAAVVDRHPDVRASTIMTVDIDDDGDDGNFLYTLSGILGSFELAMRLLSFQVPCFLRVPVPASDPVFGTTYKLSNFFVKLVGQLFITFTKQK